MSDNGYETTGATIAYIVDTSRRNIKEVIAGRMAEYSASCLFSGKTESSESAQIA